MKLVKKNGMTLQDVCDKVSKKLGVYAYQICEDSVMVTYMYYNVLRDNRNEFLESTATFSGTPHFVYNDIMNWAFDPRRWIVQGRTLVCDPKIKQQDIQEYIDELLYDVGFKNVEVSFADCNFAEIVATYNYIEDRSVGIKKICEKTIIRSSVGNIQRTVEELTQWFKNNPDTVKCKHKQIW